MLRSLAQSSAPPVQALLAQSKLLQGFMVAGSAKALGSLISVVFSIVAARALGATEAGYLFLGLTLLHVGSAVFRLGFDGKLARSFGPNGIAGASNRTLNLAVTNAALVAAVVCALIYLNADALAAGLFAKPEMAPVLRYVSLALPFLALLNLMGFAFQGVGRPLMTVFGQNLGFLSFALIAVFVLHSVMGQPLNAEDASAALFGAVLLSLLIALLVWFVQPGAAFQPQMRMAGEERASNFDLWVAMLMTLTVSWSGVLVGGVFVSAAELAQVAAAQRVAILVIFVLLVCDIIVSPRYARLFVDGDMPGMRQLARFTTWAMVSIAVPLAIGITLLADQIMSLFGPEFSAAGAVLIAFTAAQTINLATGSVSQLLIMSGHERDYRRVTVIAALLTLVLTLLLASTYGGIGIALACAAGIITQNLLSYFAVRRRLGFFPGF
ncbi:MAG: polysaccharide biosynthesis C-terminal domain-containing protein [Devosiaceae bacterium]|nr:polysaccharide biosynthesis C-terminal domain-containing protein [Devosiaceae bacterium MH13]